MAGVGWILAEKWYPYQRPTFVTPPFAGYVSGHSTYSRASADVMTAITGSQYFPGGMGTFDAPMNQYLVFEEGPSMNVELQWVFMVQESSGGQNPIWQMALFFQTPREASKPNA